jgi:Glycosyl transferase family 2
VDVVIVIPAFNEAATVGEIVAAARLHGPVLVVDDGSTDDTAARASAAGATVLRHATRRGKGAAIATAVGAARTWGASRVVTLDADGQHDPDDLPALLAAAHAAPSAVIVGARGDDALPHARALAGRVAGFWMNWVTGEIITDTQSGFRVYPMGLFDDTAPRGGRFVFETAILVDALGHGRLVHEVPIRSVPYAARPSRFHPVGDGVAIATYLVLRSVGRWGTELAAGAREFGRVFRRERRTARHARMLARASAHAGSPAWGPAIGLAAAAEIRGGLGTWWRDPRAARARRAALATIASPVLLGLVVLNVAARGALATVLDRMIRTIYDQRTLPALAPDDGHARVENSQTWVTVAR